MPRLIVNADDYGHSPGVSAGIRKAHRDGIVTSATAMMNFADAIPAIDEARATCPRLALGVHLVATDGAPLLPPERVPTLVTAEGRFFGNARFSLQADAADRDQLRAEWRAQIERFLGAGARLDHLDSHHHAAFRTAKTIRVLAELAEEYGVPVRVPYDRRVLADPAVKDLLALLIKPSIRFPDGGMIDTFYDDGATLESLLDIIAALPDGATLELMTHPGFADAEIVETSSYSFARERELAVLTDPRVRAALDARGVELITFAQV